MKDVFAFLIYFLLIGLPSILTVCNVVALSEKAPFKPRTSTVIDALTFFLGVIYTAGLVAFIDYRPWHEQLHVDQGSYSPISFEALPTFLVLCAVAVVSYVVLRWFGKKLSPVIASLCYAGMFLGICLTVMLVIQLAARFNMQTALLLLFPINYVLCSVRLMRNTVAEYAEKIAQTTYRSKLLQRCQKFLSRSVGFMTFSFILAVPLLLVMMVMLLLFGQQPDSVIKMFTETAEWTLSQKIPPPRLDYDAHYLCTVAACGDEKVVKPLRAGRRRNALIVVNRQLLVANAFEDLLAEKTPRLHKIIRKTYDRVGLPISRYITTKRRSNAVYWLMKPLEWLFVVLLYTFDTKPENRIHSQYTK